MPPKYAVLEWNLGEYDDARDDIVGIFDTLADAQSFVHDQPTMPDQLSSRCRQEQAIETKKARFSVEAFAGTESVATYQAEKDGTLELTRGTNAP